ncbi:MAG: cytochrome c [Thiohalocapsa sp.]
MRTHTRQARVAGVALLASAIMLVVVPATAEEVSMEKAEQAIKYRQNVMSAMGGLLGTAVGQLREGFTFGPDLKGVAAGLKLVSSDVAALFPEGTDIGETKAKPEVWSDSEGFADKSTQAADAAAAFAEAVDSGDKKMMLQAFKMVGDSCKGCHEDYRAK